MQRVVWHGNVKKHAKKEGVEKIFRISMITKNIVFGIRFLINRLKKM